MTTKYFFKKENKYKDEKDNDQCIFHLTLLKKKGKLKGIYQ